MPRGRKCRRVCFAPVSPRFSPELDGSGDVRLALEEFEALRLVDRETLGQDEAAKKMDISRGTLQRILYAARFKVADALTSGKSILIEGGSYRLTGRSENCGRGCRHCGAGGPAREKEKKNEQ